MQQKHRGSHSELLAAAWLLSWGYDVFRNVSMHGEADLVAFDPITRETILIDVTTGSVYEKQDGETTIGWSRDKLHSKRDDVRVLVVMPSGECFYGDDEKYIRHKYREIKRIQHPRRDGMEGW